MAQCDGTAVGVELLIGKAQFFLYCYGLCGKGFICFDYVEIFDLISCLVHYLLGSHYGADAHDSGIASAQGSCHECSHRLYTQFLSLFFAHYDYCGCTVIDT